jgi:hypothetical protein
MFSESIVWVEAELIMARKSPGDVEKECRRVNMVQILCTHKCKWENETC